MNKRLKNISNFLLAGLRLFCLLTMIISCSGRNNWSTLVEWGDLNIDQMDHPDEYIDAGAAILLDDGKIEIFESGENTFSVFKRHRIIKIYNARGYSFTNVAVQYNPSSVINKIQARTIGPDGKITVLDDKNIFDINLYPNFVFYADQRAKIFTFPAVEDGSVLEYEFEITLRGRTFGNFWNFQNSVPTRKSRFSLLKPSQLELDYRLYGIEIEPDFIDAPDNFKSTHVWEARDLPAIKSEIAAPPSNELGARLALCPVGLSTWEEVSDWYYNLIKPQMKAGENIKPLAQELTSGIEDDVEKLRVIYEWVRDRIRYISVSIGIGGYQPYPVEDVFRNKYGDCKDMTTLLCAIAEESGLQVHEALISTWHNGVPDTSLPSATPFNHVIAYFPQQEKPGIWMDATDKTCPFGQLPWYNQGLPALVIDEQASGQLLITPNSVPDSNLTRIQWQVDLDSSGGAKIVGSSFFQGSIAGETRSELYYSDKAEQKHWIENYIVQRCPGARLDSFSVSGLNPVRDPLVLRYSFKTTTFAKRIPQALLFRPGSIISMNLPDYFRSKSRNYPVRFRFGLYTELDLEVKLPGGWSVDSISQSDSLLSPFGEGFWRSHHADGHYVSHIKYGFKGSEISPDLYPEFQAFLNGLHERDLREVLTTHSAQFLFPD